MPCPPHPIEVLESACADIERRCSGLRGAWEYLAPHVRNMVPLVKNPPENLASLLQAPIPDPPPHIPVFSGKKKELWVYGSEMEAWLKEAEPVRKILEGRVCALRTLAIRLGDAITDWPTALAERQKLVEAQQLYHRREDRKTWLRNLRWALKQDSVTETSAKQIKAQIQHLEQMDDPTLLRWIPDDVEALT